MSIKLIALDMDKTTLRSDGTLSDFTRETFRTAADEGIHIIIATGRTLCALPKDVLEVEGIHYALTSNGAAIVDLVSGETIYKNYISPDAVEDVAELLKNYSFSIEVFFDGKAYIDKKTFDIIKERNRDDFVTKYILSTREPKEDIISCMLENRNSIENINVNFENREDKEMMRPLLEGIKNVTITTSLARNLEVGGKTTSKGTALTELCGILGIRKEETMAAGDSPNDAALLLASGFPVAVANATDDVKEIAAYITDSNNDDGVAKAIRKFALKKS
ncbi:MAG: HAD family hydrolase [Clostridia bacterium]|nr:HAD family hydrolase [Clostridia bacterium]